MTERLKLIEEFRSNYRSNVRILREAGSSMEKFDFKNVISSSERRAAKEKWEKYDTTTVKQRAIFKAAKGGDRTAINYIWLKVADENVGKTFWKSFLGRDPGFRRRRLEQGDFYDWAAIAYETLTTGNKDYTDTKGALETFNPDKYSTGDLFKNFGFYYWNKLRNSAKESNYNEASSGMRDTPGIKKGVTSQQSGGRAYSVGEYDPTYMDSMQEEHDSSDPTSERFFEDEETREFISKWKQFVKDPKATTPKSSGVVPIDIFRTVIEAGPAADSYAMLADKYPQISRNSISNYLQEIVQTLNEYGIGYDDLMKAIRVLGEDEVASYIEKAPPKVERPKKREEPSSKGEDLRGKIEALNDDPHLWTSPRTNKTGTWQAGTIAYYMLKDPKLTPEKLTGWNRIPGKWNEVTMNRVKKMLKKVGIDWSEIERLPKKKRDELAEMIGSEE
jgi:hypothetical protein